MSNKRLSLAPESFSKRYGSVPIPSSTSNKRRSMAGYTPLSQISQGKINTSFGRILHGRNGAKTMLQTRVQRESYLSEPLSKHDITQDDDLTSEPHSKKMETAPPSTPPGHRTEESNLRPHPQHISVTVPDQLEVLVQNDMSPVSLIKTPPSLSTEQVNSRPHVHHHRHSILSDPQAMAVTESHLEFRTKTKHDDLYIAKVGDSIQTPVDKTTQEEQERGRQSLAQGTETEDLETEKEEFKRKYGVDAASAQTPERSLSTGTTEVPTSPKDHRRTSMNVFPELNVARSDGGDGSFEDIEKERTKEEIILLNQRSPLNFVRNASHEDGMTLTPIKGFKNVNGSSSSGKETNGKRFDFELPELTPDSIPTITLREFEEAKAKFQQEIDELVNENLVKEQEIKTLKKKLDSIESQTENRINKAVEKLSNELYVQYSKKHEMKVSLLKRNLDMKWMEKLEEKEAELKILKRDINKERIEKAELVKMWDEYEKLNS